MNLATLSALTETEAREMLERIRWPNGPVCAHCGCFENIRTIKSEARPGLYRCGDCKMQFTVRVNTVLHDSHIPYRLWLMAFSIMASAKKGISALQLQRQLGIGSYKCAWHLAHRIRHAMKQEPLRGLLTGEVEVDETYVGGKPRKFAGKVGKLTKEEKKHVGRGTKKVPVLALVERDGRIRAHVVPNVTAKTLKTSIRELVDPSAAIMTDEFNAYKGIGNEFEGGHHTVNHSRGEYKRGKASTNQVEAFFALLKRGINGSFHSVSRKHLNKYCDEFAFRWSLRKDSDADRTVRAIVRGDGKRLTYKSPIAAAQA
ncbi:MAG: IS1595 family transposase [Alphaproteobacteria bacterium]|nr:IS1595 family transposase [Alphaproteobacteria bacterium]